MKPFVIVTTAYESIVNFSNLYSATAR